MVVRQVLAAVSGNAIEAALQAAEQERMKEGAHRRSLELGLQQARYQAGLAERRYLAVDPAQRLVISELEARWNIQVSDEDALRMTHLSLRVNDGPTQVRAFQMLAGIAPVELAPKMHSREDDAGSCRKGEMANRKPPGILHWLQELRRKSSKDLDRLVRSGRPGGIVKKAVGHRN